MLLPNALIRFAFDSQNILMVVSNWIQNKQKYGNKTDWNKKSREFSCIFSISKSSCESIKRNKIDDECVVHGESKENIWLSNQFYGIWEANAKPWDESCGDGNIYFVRFSNTQLWLTFEVSLVCNRKRHTTHRYSKWHTVKCSHVASHVRSARSQSEIESPYKSFIAFYVVIWDGGLIQFHWNAIPIISAINISNSQQIYNWFLFDSNYILIYLSPCVTDTHTRTILSLRGHCTWIRILTHTHRTTNTHETTTIFVISMPQRSMKYANLLCITCENIIGIEIEWRHSNLLTTRLSF